MKTEKWCVHCGGWIGYFKADACTRASCVNQRTREQAFQRQFRGKCLRDALIGSVRLGISLNTVAELLGLDAEMVRYEWDLLRQDAR